MQAKIDVAVMRGKFSFATDTFGALARAGVLLVGLWLVKDGDITLGDLLMAGALLVPQPCGMLSPEGTWDDGACDEGTLGDCAQGPLPYLCEG